MHQASHGSFSAHHAWRRHRVTRGEKAKEKPGKCSPLQVRYFFIMIINLHPFVRARKREQENAEAIAAGLQPKITTRGRQLGAKDKAPRKRRQALQPAPKIAHVHDPKPSDKKISTDFVNLNDQNFFQSLKQLQTFGYKTDSIVSGVAVVAG
jgi:hypothetical protein